MFDFQSVPYYDPITKDWSTQATLDCEGVIVNVFFATWSISGYPLVWEETPKSEEELWDYIEFAEEGFYD